MIGKISWQMKKEEERNKQIMTKITKVVTK